MSRLKTLKAALVVAGSLLATPVFADGPARAADPFAYAPEPVQLFYDWSGLYVGGRVGLGVTRETGTLGSTGGFEANRFSSTGYVGGGQIGYQHQFKELVLGVEVSYAALDAKYGTNSVLVPGMTSSYEVTNLLLVTGKLGYAYMNYLAYLRGGYATANIDASVAGTNVGNGSARADGYVAGLGVDWAVAPHMILGVEYNFVHLSADNLAIASAPAATSFTGSSLDIQSVMLRLDFKFGH